MVRIRKDPSGRGMDRKEKWLEPGGRGKAKIIARKEVDWSGLGGGEGDLDLYSFFTWTESRQAGRSTSLRDMRGGGRGQD